MKAKIGKYATLHGNAQAARKSSKVLNFKLNESSVRHMKTKYLKLLKVDPEPIMEITNKKRGRPVAVGKELDEEIQHYIKNLRMSGGIVNRSVAQAAARGIVTARKPSLLKENGGSLDLGRGWVESFLRRMGYVKRKGTKAARHVPQDFSELKQNFLKRIRDVVRDYGITPDLVINFDQTGSKLVPSSQWTLEVEGRSQIEICGLEDKREITLVLACTMSGVLLPPQVIYAGKTERCQAAINFPETWNVTHTENHWSNTGSMIEYAEKVLLPYINRTRIGHHARALLIFDVFAAHRSKEFLRLLKDNKCEVVFVPGGCTGELQPLDVAVNEPFKKLMKDEFTAWYSGEVAESLFRGTDIEEAVIDMKISTMKPLHARWLFSAWHSLARKTSILVDGFKRAGISGAVEAGMDDRRKMMDGHGPMDESDITESKTGENDAGVLVANDEIVLENISSPFTRLESVITHTSVEAAQPHKITVMVEIHAEPTEEAEIRGEPTEEARNLFDLFPIPN